MAIDRVSAPRLRAERLGLHRVKASNANSNGSVGTITRKGVAVKSRAVPQFAVAA